MKGRGVLSLLAFFAACLAAASSGAIFKPGAWYARLEKPVWTPPNLAFPIVWTVLFTLMAVAGWLVWRERGVDAWPVLALFGVHLVVNAAWSYLFFGRRRLDWAMADVTVLAAMVATLAFLFAGVSQLAGLMLVPYLFWVLLAATLNARILQLNGKAPA